MDKTIEERADEYAKSQSDWVTTYDSSLAKHYIAGATEQKAIDIDNGKTFIKDLLLSFIGCEPKEGWIENIQNEYEKIINERQHYV